MGSKRRWLNITEIGIFAIVFSGIAFAWIDGMFTPDMTYMCRYYIGENPPEQDPYLDASTLEQVTKCRAIQHRYKQAFKPIRTCNTWDVEYAKGHPKDAPFCVVR